MPPFHVVLQMLFGGLSLSAWVWLLLWRWRFWQIERDPQPPQPADRPSVVAVIPARNEARFVAETLRTLLAQDYAGHLRLILVDDGSEDATAAKAREAAASGHRALAVVRAEPTPPGWAGKVWAMEQGVRAIERMGLLPRYVLFSDADISHGRDVVRTLVSIAEQDGRGLTSHMVRLRCESPAERWLVPAFVYFFRMLYPFRAVNHPSSRVAGAAGGAMLVRWEALQAIGGMEAIRDALIDDCALARAVKQAGFPLWLGLSGRSSSLRAYSLAAFVAMVARSAYTQLGRSPIGLAACLVGLGLLFGVPPLLALLGTGWGRWMGAGAWLLMALSWCPMLCWYGLSPLRAVAMPAVAVIYGWATFLSAWEHWHGRGGAWKGRVADRARPRQNR